MRYYSHLFQMPPKKVKHGGARVDAGRKSLTGEYGNDKTMEEKKKADRNRKAKDRGQLKLFRGTEGQNSTTVLVLLSENLVSEKSLSFGFRKFGIGKKSQYRFWSKFWYRHSVMVG